MKFVLYATLSMGFFIGMADAMNPDLDDKEIKKPRIETNYKDDFIKEDNFKNKRNLLIDIPSEDYQDVKKLEEKLLSSKHVILSKNSDGLRKYLENTTKCCFYTFLCSETLGNIFDIGGQVLTTVFTAVAFSTSDEKIQKACSFAGMVCCSGLLITKLLQIYSLRSIQEREQWYENLYGNELESKI